VVALAYMLERDTHGIKHLRTEPPPLVLSKHKFNKSSKQPGRALHLVTCFQLNFKPFVAGCSGTH